MSLSKLSEWRVIIRNRTFPGRSIPGRLYRFLLFSILNPLFQLVYRLRIALQEGRLEPFQVSDYLLLKRVRALFPAPYLARRWVRKLLNEHHPTRYSDILASIHSIKSRTETAHWLLPETALLALDLDCKGFSVLFSALLNAMGIKNELWIGIPADGRGGHAWVVLETFHGRIAIDQFNGNGTDETVYLLNHLFAMTIRI